MLKRLAHTAHRHVLLFLVSPVLLDILTFDPNSCRISNPVNSNAPNLHPVSSRYDTRTSFFGKLDLKEQWTCAGGFVRETLTFYTITDQGISLTSTRLSGEQCNIHHETRFPHLICSLWYLTVQFTLVHMQDIQPWKCINITVTLDKCSSKGDQFSITYKSNPGSDYPESYTINTNLAAVAGVS